MGMSMFEACDRHSRNGGAFPSRAAAFEALARWRERGTIRGNPEPFKCKARNHWHLGRDNRFRWRSA